MRFPSLANQARLTSALAHVSFAVVFMTASSFVLPVQGQSLPTAAENLTPGDIDSEHLFGFTEGSDLGVPGEVELEWETSARLGKRSGRFLAIDSGLALKVPLTANVRLAPGVTFNAYDVAAPGGPTRTSGGINGGFIEARARFLDRRQAPFGLTLNVVPSFGTLDAGSGRAARSFGAEVGILADRELIPGKLVAAVNVGAAFNSTGLDGTSLLGSGVEAAAAIAYQYSPGLFLGAEARYARAYGDLTLDRLAGHAVYLGPTAYVTLSAHTWASLTWNFQVAGQAVGELGPLDLTGFDRHQVRLRVGYSF